MGKSHEEKNARGETDAAFLDRMEQLADDSDKIEVDPDYIKQMESVGDVTENLTAVQKWGPESAVAVPARTLARVVERVEAVAERLNPQDAAELRAALDPLRP